ncbi:hypothetical protein EJ06DRAFT_546130 [Trichodelitschia bisporula]|uniref:Peptidase S28 n=1 Tax=Trichodelitschia bisporula TaxID=703511 RepID=A0A6G1I7B1_9PEZI|nr:hypothetical protein EJ06DRAFT_546130 [Trichodelitschia bisporula]
MASFAVRLALACFFIHNVAAFLGGLISKYDIMASMDLLPDGTPMEIEDTDDDWRTKANIRQIINGTNGTEHILTEYVTLPIDHFGEGAGTFNNRFWVSEIDYKPGGPIFVYDVGEANASTNGVQYQRLMNETSFFKQMVRRYHGIGIVWEHRFYGNSSPHNISLNTPAKHFEFHTTEQALADVPTFAWNFTRKSMPDVDLTPASTPWVFVGGSYPGMRASFMRRFYPGTIFAGYSAAAPVEAAIDMSVYFEPIWEGMHTYGWANCSQDIKAAVQAVDSILEDPAEAIKIKERFLGRTAGNNTNAGFADALSTIFFLWQSYGVDGGPQGLRSFCNWIERDPVTNTTSDARGWAAVRGVDYVLGRWASWPFFASAVNENLFTHCEGGPTARRILNSTLPKPNMTTTYPKGPRPAQNATRIVQCNLEERFPEPAAISWTWQYCTTWGFLQSVNLGPHQLLSKYNSLVHQRDICHRQFPDGLKSGLLPLWPDVKSANARFGGWRSLPPRTFHSGGQFDPWRTLSVLSDQPLSPRYAVTHNIPSCSAPSGKIRVAPDDGSWGSVFGYVVPGGEHAYDFRTSFVAGRPAIELFNKALDEWLKCWKPLAAGGAPGVLPGNATNHTNELTLPDPPEEDEEEDEERRKVMKRKHRLC